MVTQENKNPLKVHCYFVILNCTERESRDKPGIICQILLSINATILVLIIITYFGFFFK